MPTRKYYVMVPASHSYNGEPYWQEVHDVKSLTAAQHYADLKFAGLPEVEIGVSTNEGEITVNSKKNKAGTWDLVLYQESREDSSPHANDQIQYYLDGKLVSREDFYKYGFHSCNKTET